MAPEKNAFLRVTIEYIFFNGFNLVVWRQRTWMHLPVINCYISHMDVYKKSFCVIRQVRTDIAKEFSEFLLIWTVCLKKASLGAREF